MNKFEKLIEYVINDEDQKASDLFHEIVVEKSRNIYEGFMNEEEDEDIEEGLEGQRDQIQQEETFEADDEFGDEGGDEFGEPGMDDMGDEGMGDMEGGDEFGDEGMGDEFGGEESGSEVGELVGSIESDLAELEAMFAELTGGENDEFGGSIENDGMDDGGAIGGDQGDDMVGDTEFDDEEDEFGESRSGFNENMTLDKVTTGISNSTESEGTNKKSVNADNSGKRGAVSKPVSTNTSEEAGGNVDSPKDEGSTTEPNEKAAPKPKTGEDGAVNKKSIH